MATLTALILVSSVVFPVLARSERGTERAWCFNNLRLLGRGIQEWAASHVGEPPWWTDNSLGGTRFPGGPRPPSGWFEFMSFSNHFQPTILACPADSGVKVAPDWQSYLFELRQTSLSYLLGVHARSENPGAWLSGDRNVVTDGAGATCASGIANANLVLAAPSNSALSWTNGAAHGETGHILLNNGSVEFTSSTRLRELALAQGKNTVETNNLHILRAR